MLNIRHAACAALASVLLAMPAVHAGDATPPPIPDDLQPAVLAAEETGRRLQRLDRAAWIATDVMQADRSARRLRRSVRGWITEATGTGTRVSFHDGSQPARPVYIVDVDQTGRSSVVDVAEGAAFDAGAQAMIRARNAALSQAFLQCSRTYNSVVFPKDEEIHVYLMPGTKQHHVYPAGGHHLFVFDAEGSALRSNRKFTNGCIDLGGGGERMAALMVTHLLDPQPTEIHVFISLNAPIPLMVATSSPRSADKPMGWVVEQGRIGVLFHPDDPD
ncbi:hypothetical protein E2F46_12330 [Luteimonas aestuarii]|uniref:Uncharacterized protein n=1 Tax=Luteimonas aestuarii TaxID=453837 RepID=A0A4R5TKT8_9GAMM|nr:hypothetical protein [Luteimonas aestuarii]TDK23143.1 hypothetical protein E2F46_12330 [Luteimonas aestuarii]